MPSNSIYAQDVDEDGEMFWGEDEDDDMETEEPQAENESIEDNDQLNKDSDQDTGLDANNIEEKDIKTDSKEKPKTKKEDEDKKLLLITMLLSVGYSQSNQPIVTVLTKYMTVTGTIIKYDDEKVIIYGAASGMPSNINISKSNIELSIKDILLIDYGIKTIYKIV